MTASTSPPHTPHRHLQTLKATQNSLNNLIKKISALDSQEELLTANENDSFSDVEHNLMDGRFSIGQWKYRRVNMGAAAEAEEDIPIHSVSMDSLFEDKTSQMATKPNQKRSHIPSVESPSSARKRSNRHTRINKTHVRNLSRQNSQETHQWNQIIDNLQKSKQEREEYIDTHSHNRFHQYYSKFLSHDNLKPLKKKHKTERTKFQHIAQNLMQDMDDITEQINRDFSAYCRKAKMENSLRQREEKLSWNTAATDASSEAFRSDSEYLSHQRNHHKHRSADSFQMEHSDIHSPEHPSFNDSQTLVSPKDDPYAYSTGSASLHFNSSLQDSFNAGDIQSPLKQNSMLQESSNDWEEYKQSLRNKDLKRRERLRTRAAIIDLKQKKKRNTVEGSEQEQMKQDIQRRLAQLQQKQKHFLKRSKSNLKSRANRSTKSNS